MRRRAALVAVLALAATPAAARAGGDDATAEAARRFERGIKLFERGDHLAALAELEAARRIVPRFEVLFNIGVIQKRLFRYGDAVRTFELYLEEGGERVPADRRAAVEREMSEIRALVAEIEVEVEGPPAELDVDGVAAGTSPLDRPLLVGPGRHEVRARRAGETDAERSVDVVSGARVKIVLAPVPIARTSTTAWLAISSQPAGAEITVDGRLRGRDPWTAKLNPGGHRVELELGGYRRASLEVMLTAGQNRPLVVELEPLPEEERWYEQWYWWAAIGVAAAGAGAATFVLTREVPDVQIDYP